MSTLYHQTDISTAEIILRTQKMKPGSGGLAGGGIYFATTPEFTGHKAHKKGMILEATVALGRIHTLPRDGDPQMTLQKLKDLGFDSVCIARAVSSGQEYVVYDPNQVKSIRRLDNDDSECDTDDDDDCYYVSRGCNANRGYAGGYSGSTCFSVRRNPTGPLKADGTPDMRYIANRTAAQADTPARRASHTARSNPTGPLKADGTPDMRFKANRR